METWTAGLDWGAGSHALCVLDARGAVVERFEVEHTREGLARMLARLAAHAEPGASPSPSSGPPA